MKKANFGSGPDIREGWANIDRERLPGVDIRCDVLGGLPCKTGEFDLIVTHHALQMMTAHDVVLALRELRRVTKPGGWIRVSVPNIEEAMTAYHLWPDRTFLTELFPMSTCGGEALNRYLTHYGQRSYWTSDSLYGAVRAAGWEMVSTVAHGMTKSDFPEAVELDNRPAESLYVEAVAP